MYLSGHIIGLSYLSFVPQIVIPTAFEKVTLYGQQTVDYLWVKNKVLTDTELDNIVLPSVPVWDADTILLANYSDNINAGNIATLENPIIKWNIQRQEGTDPIRKNIATVSNTTYEYIDYTAVGNKTYQYFIFPITATETGEPLASNSINANFNSWSLTDTANNVVFLFDLNLESGDLTNETDRSEYPTYQKFNKISRGKRDFMRGSVSCIAGYINNNGAYESPISYISLLKDTINNGNTKYLKSRKGDIFAVDTYDFRYKYMDDISDQPQTISFNFCEVSEVV